MSNEKKNMRSIVSAAEDALDTAGILVKGLVAVGTIITGGLTLFKCCKTLKIKSEDREGYWERKYAINGNSKLIHDGLDKVAGSIDRLVDTLTGNNVE